MINYFNSALIFTVLFSTCCIIGQANTMKASCFGDSYIQMPLQEAKNATNIRIKFRTQQENAFIFLAAGRTDYCLITLDSGQIKLIFQVESQLVEIRSSEKHILNDLEWHDISVQRYESNLSLQVDSTILKKALPPNMLALNVHFGIYLGGVGDFSYEYLSADQILGFRGCVSDIYYNNINIIKRAKERTRGAYASECVSWNCSSEFDAGINNGISFMEDDSFALLTKQAITPEEIISFEVRTIEEMGVLYFNGGPDFIFVEVIDQKLRLLINKSGVLFQLSTNTTISDGNWHRVMFRYNSASIELFTDDNQIGHTFLNDTESAIELSESFYLGGVTDNVRRKYLDKGLRINEMSLKGCLRYVKINNQPTGFPHMTVSQKLDIDCVWRYPCIDDEPCLKSAACHQYGNDEFICYCEQSFCLKADYQLPYKIFTNFEPEMEVMNISPMQLLEGGTIYLSPSFIEILFDITKFRLTDNSVLFTVIHQPKFGIILQYSNEIMSFTPCKVFNMQELSTDKIKYVHNGAESFDDHATIDMQIYGDTSKVAPNFLGKHRFLLHANITPVNDPPTLQIPSNKILRLIEGIPKVLNTELFSIVDPDSSPTVLIYTILPNTDTKAMYGRFELNGKSTLTFSQYDVNSGKVSYIFNATMQESSSFHIIIQVSDGIETSDTVYLPVSVHPLEIRIANNTGLIMIHKSLAYLTPTNLSIATNAAEESIDIKYDVVKSPQYGTIQRLRQIDSSWINVASFTDSQLLLGHVRYLHNKDLPWQDEFKFVASYGLKSTQTYDFRITFTRLRINAKKQPVISIKGSKETILTKDVLSYETIPLPTFPRNIIYKIVQPTKYGSIYVNGYPRAAKEMDSFTQMDVDKNLIRYRTHRVSYSSFVDYLDFVVSVSECDDVVGTLKITFNPYEKFAKRLFYQTKEILKDQEGDRALLTKRHFEVNFNIFDKLTFTISKPPEHGTLCKYDSHTSKTEQVTTFSIEELDSEQVYYCHDDTESQSDSFHMLIVSDETIDMEYVCEVDVEITLINDNSPYRTVDKNIYVVRGGMRTLNSDELQYHDKDINTNLLGIHYTHVSSTNGDFYKTGLYTNHFTQDDINNRRIIFQHTGPDIGTASFVVTDGIHEVHGLVEVHASEPFISMQQTNATIVQESKFVILNNKDLMVKTNLDMKLDKIYYEVIKPPSYGILMYLGRRSNNTVQYKTSNFTSLTNFTHLDIERERLVYWNTEIASMDKIKYRVNIKNISTEGEIIFRIYPSAYWEPLKVISNQTLYVEESTSMLISRDIIEVVHPNISPGDITFLVTSSPLHGYLEMQSMNFDDEYNCKVFDQSSINFEKMFYIQAGLNQSLDYFIFDVTNGITWLRGLMLKIIIIPEKLYMKTNVLSVVEGKTVTVKTEDIDPFSEYYKSKILEYKIINSPANGFIMAGNSNVKRFTQKQLDQGSIQYVHNGNENATDVISLVAMARNKESVQFDLHVVVTPVNDEVPMVVTNTGLQVWNGGVYVIKNSDLMAQDYDTPPENLTYIIHHIYGGYIANKATPRVKIEKFTQGDVNFNEIVFVHDLNSRRNEMSFYVTDGLFNTTDQTLEIYPKPVMVSEVHNDNLHVFPLTKKQILRDHLQYLCSDESREIKYNITITPSLGRILYEDPETGVSKESIGFTQDDINNGRVFYEHTAVMQQFRINDSFYFDVVGEKADRLMDQKFNIEISVSSGGLLRFLPVSKIEVEEGDSAPIKLDFSKILEYLNSRAGITNPELYIETIQKPSFGIVQLTDDNTQTTKFHSSDFSTGKVFYTHDHSDTLEDTILMSVYLEQGKIFLCNLTIPVSIQPVNDQPFVLVTQTPHMTVVEGENKTITRNILLTEDKDTPPDEIFYYVISGPTSGTLMKISPQGYAQDILAYSNQFTQADVNNDRILYVHYGPPQSTTFYFNVSDGQFKPAYEIFNIKIAPVSIIPEDDFAPISVQQGATSSVLRPSNLVFKTNVHLSRILYNITNSPLHGIVLLDHQPTLRFSQQQLENGQITYMQTNMDKSNDTFQIIAYIAETVYGTSMEVKVVIEPVIRINDIDIVLEVEQDKIKLQSFPMVNNPVYLKLNKTNPKFVIFRPPKYGSIRKIIRNSGDNEAQNIRSITVFSYKELRSGVIFYVSHGKPKSGQSDSFEYNLLIKSVQPAQALVKIDYHTEEDSNPSIILTTSNLNLNYFGILVILMAIILLILIIMLILKFRYIQRKKSEKHKDHPPSLPCPPDLTSVGPVHMYANSDIDSIPVTAASTPLPGFSNIPHCKVIPVENYKNVDYGDYGDMGDCDDDDDDMDDPAETQHMVPCANRYNNPYLDNDAWSSSCDMTNDFGYSSVPQNTQQNNSSNPLLRRNQYWV